MESFYHCGDGDSSAPLAIPIEREVTACDYPIEHVEKAVVWRLQQPSSTKAALFVNAFNLSAAQLNQLLEIGDSLNHTRSSTLSEADLDEAACLWLNNNTATWEAWLPDFELYDTLLYQWDWWLGVCCAVSLFGGIIIYIVVHVSKELGEEQEAVAKNAIYSTFDDKKSFWPHTDKSHKQHDKQAAPPTAIATKVSTAVATAVASFSCKMICCSCKMINSEEWAPVLKYLSNARRCMMDCGFLPRFVFFLLGQLFVGASTGFLEGLIYDSWLTDGLNQLSLEVTISCAILMLTLELAKWGLGRLPSGEQVVRRQLQIRLRIKYFKELKPTLEQKDKKTRLYCVEQFDEAIKSTASELASDCYSAAWSAFSDSLGFLSAVGFLFYYTFEEGIPQDVSSLMIAAFICAPTLLVSVLIIGPLVKRKLAKSTTDYKTAYGGILSICVYVLWAFGPILINPLKNDLGPGTNFVPLPDLLTASNDTQYISMLYSRHFAAPL